MKISQQSKNYKKVESLTRKVTGKRRDRKCWNNVVRYARSNNHRGVARCSQSRAGRRKNNTRVHEEGTTGDVARLARQEGLDWSTIIIIILSCRDNLSGGGNIDNSPK